MITIPEVVEQIVVRSPFLMENIHDGIINLSALARKIKPEIEKKLYKKVEEGAILMALRRLAKNTEPNLAFKKIIQSNYDLIVRSNLIEIVMPNVDFSIEMHKDLITLSESQEKFFMTITEGVFETTIIASNELYEEIKKILSRDIIHEMTNLASITIRMPKENVQVPGLYYYFLKALAWEEINVIEVVSTYTEITIIMENKEIDRAFSVLKSSLNPEII
ncbi:MAG: hypothetical protein US11_C0001G0170 [Candidatus Roizmanbacteria bacterium GW2011_GWA2_36_23]|uniref:Aspartate kinase n=1 Tax=Candidatus Roizmanbacteria bacterium GW2011_GWA2_36_23 TaxID=1618480 RepID=A0A0G0HE72_9BACT|nr:MAG: hypothetical protein US11_C0001G0170 [Candidatus Roizmanbacteria bacterium GW2011_GWA2_36_23]